MEKNYPEKIYPGVMNIFGAKARRTPNIFDIEHAYDIGVARGKEQSDPLAGFSNLTEAIKDEVDISLSQLDGREAIAKHDTLGLLRCKLERDAEYPEYSPRGWWKDGTFDGVQDWGDILFKAWYNHHGWSLWVEGEIPVKPRSVDELKGA